MSEILIWFIAFCIILGLEMVFSTVYLLALAAGALSAALSCLIGHNTTAHITVAAFITVLGAIGVYLGKKRQTKKQAANKTQYPDEGREITVAKVVDGVARVTYRGASWDAVCEEEELKAGIWKIKRVDGTRLILESTKAPNTSKKSSKNS